MPEQRNIPTVEKNIKKMSLGEFLADIRSIKRQSLREVQEATGNDVSNAYLSQLEKGHIKKPSPNILYALANAYSIPYDTLMEKAGYITTESAPYSTNVAPPQTFSIANEKLSSDEEEALLEYLAFIRSKKKKPISKSL